MKRKIVFILSSLNVGGAEKQLSLLYRSRPESMRSVDVELVILRPTPCHQSLENEFSDMGVKFFLVDRNSQSFPSFFIQLVRKLRQLKPDLVHTLLPSSSGTWGRLAAIIVNVPIIFHSDLQDNPPGLTRSHILLRPFLDRFTNRFLPCAEAIAEVLIRKGIRKEKIFVVPVGIDFDQFRPEGFKSLRPDWGIPEQAIVAGFLAKFRPEKRLDLLLDAVLALNEAARPDFVVLGGDGPVMPMVRKRVEGDPWLKNHCRILGLIQNTQDFFKSIDYLVLPSDTEGLPTVLLEAMAMEKPFIASRVSDVPVLAENVGILMEPMNTRSLVDAFSVMQNLTREERVAMGTKAREKVIETYEISRIAERFWGAHLEFLA